ncbi:MAG: sodium:calcium antiporter [Solirubrobacterales bacterium]
MAGNLILLAASFAVILAGALLFTNAVEWLGHRLAIGEGAVGSLLAAVGTAMPESLIPIVAVIQGGEGSEDVAIGAIVGAPFLLATIAMMLVGLSALAYRSRRPQGRSLEAHAPTLQRDLTVFLVFFTAALLLGVGLPEGVRIVAAVAMVIGYAAYVRRTLTGGGELQPEETLGPLLMDRSRGSDPTMRTIVIQFAVGLGAMVGGAHLFVEEVITVAEEIGAEVLVLSLVLAPLATELPEKANSFFWVREGKDALALGNITGAMVFQSTLPVALGLAFTAWEFDVFAIVAAVLGLAGGAIAIWALQMRRRFGVVPIVLWAALWAAFVAVIVVAG